MLSLSLLSGLPKLVFGGLYIILLRVTFIELFGSVPFLSSPGVRPCDTRFYG
jgi:hypothetical protein